MKKISIQDLFIPGTFKAVLGLGVTTTIGYGTLFYSFTILSLELESYFGWSKSFLFGVFSLGLLLGGLPLYILGANNYGKNSGYLNLYIKVITAITPFSFAFMLEYFGNNISVGILLILSAVSVISLYFIPREIKYV